jgi:hypothetical protein
LKEVLKYIDYLKCGAQMTDIGLPDVNYKVKRFDSRVLILNEFNYWLMGENTTEILEHAENGMVFYREILK